MDSESEKISRDISNSANLPPTNYVSKMMISPIDTLTLIHASTSEAKTSRNL